MLARLIVGYCGDYYCEEDHPICVVTTEADEEDLMRQALAMQTWNVVKGKRTGSHWNTYSDVRVIDIPVDAVPTEKEQL